MIRFYRNLTLKEFMKHRKTFLLIMATHIFGIVSGILFFLFLFLGSISLIDLGMGNSKSLLFDTVLSVLFFLQHSVIIRRSFRKKLAGFIPDEYYAAFYGCSSGIALFLVMLFWQKIPVLITAAEGVSLIMLRIIFFLCLAGFFWGVKSLGSFDVLGTEGLIRHLRKKEEIKLPFTVKGPYRWVRHPLYLFMIILIWSSPVITADRLIFNILWTIWIVVGTLLEERDLLREFKKNYQQYKTDVPMLMPYKIPLKTIKKKGPSKNTGVKKISKKAEKKEDKKNAKSRVKIK